MRRERGDAFRSSATCISDETRVIPGIRVESAVEKSAAPKGAFEQSAASTRRRVSLIRHLHFRRDETGTQYACRGAAENVRRHCSDWCRSSSFYMTRASIVMVACMRSYSSSLARFWLAAFFVRHNFLHFDCDAIPSLLQPICFWLYISSRPHRLHCEDRA